MPVQCPEHPHAIVSIDEGFPCPVCFLLDSQREQIDALLATEAGLRHTLATVRYMATAMVGEIDETRPIESVHRPEPAPTGQVQAGLGSEPSKPVLDRTTVKADLQAAYDAAMEGDRSAEATEIMATAGISDVARSKVSTANLADALARIRVLVPVVAPAAEPEATAEAEPAVEPGPTVEQEEATGEEEPAARLTESEYIAELRLRFTDRTTLAKVYRDLIGYSPPPNMEPVEMRAVMAADQWSKGLLRGPIEDEDTGPAEDLDRADQDAPPGDPPPTDEIPF